MADIQGIVSEILKKTEPTFAEAAFVEEPFEIPGIPAFERALDLTEEVLKEEAEPTAVREISKGLARGFRTVPNIVTDTLSILGIEEPREFLKETERFIEPSPEVSRPVRIASEIASGIGQMVSVIGTFGKGGALPGLALSSGTSKTRELQEEGVDTPTALGVGAANAVLTAATEMVPLGALFKKNIGFARRLLTTTIADIIGEEVEEFGARGIDTLVLDKPFPSAEEAKSIALDTALVSAGVSGVMSAGVSLAEKGQPAPEPIKSAPEAELALDIDQKTPKPSVTLESLDPPDKLDSFENERAPSRISENANIEKGNREIFTEPNVLKNANKEYKKLVNEGIIKERSDKDIGTIIPKIQFPHTLAKQQPKFKPIYERGLEYIAATDRRIGGYAESLTPYLNLRNKKNVDKALLEERVDRADTPLSFQEKLQRMTPEEIEAHTAVRVTLNKVRADMADHLIKMGNDPDTVTEFVNRLEDTYVPLKRIGDFFVAVRDRTGTVIHYSHHKNQKNMRSEAVKWKGKGEIKTGKIKKTSDEVINEIPVNLISLIAQVDKKIGIEVPKVFSEILQFGFPTYLIETKKTSGFETELAKPISDYLMGVSKWMSRREARVDFAQHLAKIDPKVESNLFTESKKYIDYMTGSTNELSKLRQWMFRFYLGGNLKSAMVNATQTLTSTYPALSKYTNKPSIRITSAMKDATQSLERISRKDPDLADGLRMAIFDGVINEQMVTMLRGAAFRDINLNRLDNALSFYFNHTETFNRKVSFIAAYKTAREGVKIKDFDGKKRRVKMSHEEAIKFGEDFIRETQFEYSKADRPPIARGKFAPAFTFRTFSMNYLSMLKNFLTQSEFGALARSLGMLTTLGGVTAIPGAELLEKVLEAFGYDPKKEAREVAGDWGDLLLYGAAFPTGVDISGSLGNLEMVPNDIQQGAWPAIANIILGVPTDLPKRINRAIFFAKDLRDPWRAVEAIMPEAVRNPMVAARWYKEGAARTPFGEPIADPKAFDIVLKALSFQPALLTRAYEREHSEKLLSERARSVSENMSFLIARAIFEEDQEGLLGLLKEISDHNMTVDSPENLIIINERSIKDQLTNMIMPEAVELKRLPKKARQEFFKIQETIGR